MDFRVSGGGRVEFRVGDGGGLEIGVGFATAVAVGMLDGIGVLRGVVIWAEAGKSRDVGAKRGGEEVFSVVAGIRVGSVGMATGG